MKMQSNIMFETYTRGFLNHTNGQTLTPFPKERDDACFSLHLSV